MDEKEITGTTVEVEETKITPWQKVQLARHPQRSKAIDYIEKLFPDFMELHGDRLYGDDQALIGGLATFNGKPVTILAQNKGKSLEENLKCNFGMMNPEGYRKVIRLAKQAEKFHRPIITIVDTSGAYPGMGAEERGQAESIAKCLFEFSKLETVVICLVISEGGSGGALALSVADRIIMLEHAIYSILSPEGFASILWKDGSRAQEASAVMKLTAQDLKDKKIVDEIIKEPIEGVQTDFDAVVGQIEETLKRDLTLLSQKKMKILLQERYSKFRVIGS